MAGFSLIDEVMDEIESALQDPKGLVAHQRRIAFSLSLGIVFLLQSYLQKKQVFKPGAKINHLWLKKKKENVLDILSKHITCDPATLSELEHILSVANTIGTQRNTLAYGKQTSEQELQKIIKTFLDLKKEVEHA